VRFEISARDGLARIGVLEIDGVERPTPTICHIDTPRYPAPQWSLRIKTPWESEKGSVIVAPSAFTPDQPGPTGKVHMHIGFRGSPYADALPKDDLARVGNPSEMLLDSKRFADSIETLKSSDDLLKPTYCSVMGLPHRLALLAYCGFDLFDSIPLIMAAENGTYLTPTGALAYDRVADLPCSCPACSSGRRSREELLKHNYATAENEIKLVRHAISEGGLRELVEGRIRSDPWLVQSLRLLDLEHYDLQERHAPVVGSRFHAGSKESLSRPDIVRWRKRLMERYRRPPSANVLLLIPCSAKKPYSLSKSHARFREALLASGRYDLVHEVIVTSPLGLVPRELELFYPAKDYDIPVTGHWDRDEKRMVEEMVSWLVESQRYDLVISHLGDEREPVNSVLRDFEDTSGGDPGSQESLAKLERTLSERVDAQAADIAGARALENMRALCRFQFGEAGEQLCDGVAITGRWPNLKIVRGRTQLGMLTGDRGMVSLTMDGARVISASSSYCVEIDDFVPKGNLFAVGVEKAGQDIRIGDDVAVVHGKEVRAVGVARMTPIEMELAERGEAVHIRHSL